MKQILQLSEKIRAYTYKWNTELYEQLCKNHPDEWNGICAAMDILDDTCLALEDYESHGIGNSDSEKYLRLYGLLQGVFLQQDSIRHLHKAFVGTALAPTSDSAWAEIRDLRNLTVGHPIEKKNGQVITRCFISRVTIRSDGFQLIVWNKERNVDEIKSVDLRSMHERYKSEAVTFLESICKTLAATWGELNDDRA
jgi:hypothetical protein